MDRVGDVIAGSAQPGSPVDVAVLHRKNLQKAQEFLFSTTADGTGHYEIDTTYVRSPRGSAGSSE